MGGGGDGCSRLSPGSVMNPHTDRVEPWTDLDTFMAEQQERILRTLAEVDTRREDRRWTQKWTGRMNLTEFEHRK